MSNITYNRDVPASDATMTGEYRRWSLSKSQWILYYWLLAHSKWNSFEKEEHYYIYRNSFTYPQIMKDTGIKSAQTIVNGLKRLEEVHAIQKDPIFKEAFQLLKSKPFVPIDTAVLKYLLSFNEKFDPAMLITMLAILTRWFNSQKKEMDDRISNKSSISFTLTELGRLMGIAKSNVTRADLFMALTLLAGSDLIVFDKSFYTNRLKQPCVRYTVTEVRPEGTDFISAMLNEDDIPDDDKINQLWQQICSVTWEELGGGEEK